MGYLTEADALVKNATEVINTIYSTNFSQFSKDLVNQSLEFGSITIHRYPV